MQSRPCFIFLYKISTQCSILVLAVAADGVSALAGGLASPGAGIAGTGIARTVPWGLKVAGLLRGNQKAGIARGAVADGAGADGDVGLVGGGRGQAGVGGGVGLGAAAVGLAVVAAAGALASAAALRVGGLGGRVEALALRAAVLRRRARGRPLTALISDRAAAAGGAAGLGQVAATTASLGGSLDLLLSKDGAQSQDSEKDNLHHRNSDLQRKRGRRVTVS